MSSFHFNIYIFLLLRHLSRVHIHKYIFAIHPYTHTKLTNNHTYTNIHTHARTHTHKHSHTHTHSRTYTQTLLIHPDSLVLSFSLVCEALYCIITVYRYVLKHWELNNLADQNNCYHHTCMFHKQTILVAEYI